MAGQRIYDLDDIRNAIDEVYRAIRNAQDAMAFLEHIMNIEPEQEDTE